MGLVLPPLKCPGRYLLTTFLKRGYFCHAGKTFLQRPIIQDEMTSWRRESEVKQRAHCFLQLWALIETASIIADQIDGHCGLTKSHKISDHKYVDSALKLNEKHFEIRKPLILNSPYTRQL